MNEALQAVIDINFSINDENFFGNNPDLCLEYVSVAYAEAVKFAGVCIWSSEWDEREYDYEKDEYTETLKEHFLSKIEEIAKNILKFVELVKNNQE